MIKVFIIHGFEGSPNGGWRPWLMAELEKHDIYACALPMPSPENPQLNEWIEEIDRHLKKEDEIYLIGHSLGVPAIFHYLERTNKNIAGAVLVSGPLAKVGNSKVDGFLSKSFDFEKIKNHCNNFAVIHGDDDPLVPLSDGKTISQKLNCKLRVIKNGKHLNTSAGFYSLPECLEELMAMK